MQLLIWFALIDLGSAYTLMARPARPRQAASPRMMAGETAASVDVESVQAPAAATDYAAGEAVSEEVSERFKAITLTSLDTWSDKYPRLKENLQDIQRAALIFPFKASPYLVDELIDWEMEGDIKDDPFYKLVFPTMAMLSADHRKLLEDTCDEGDPFKIKDVVETIREDLNPHPAGQKTLNAPKKEELTGVQHKYSETVLFFPAAAQTCHAYCTYCFRWAQFIGDTDLRFAQKDAEPLFDYIAEHPEISDILFTGGDPMFMKTRLLKAYLQPFTDPAHLPHVKNLRVGTRALSFWPQRFTTDDDADELMQLLKDVQYKGGRHIAIMAHLSHKRELSTDKVKAAIRRLRDEANVNIRSQSPVMKGINDDGQVWADKWREEVRLGIVPYYMFVARDTGARAFFDVPLVRAQKLYADAIRNTSGLCRTARGPSMSCTPGKVEITGVQEIMGVPAFVLRFLQCRDEEWIGKVFFAKWDPKAVWYDDLEPLDGMELPWEYTGLPRPCIDQDCQLTDANMNEFLS